MVTAAGAKVILMASRALAAAAPAGVDDYLAGLRDPAGRGGHARSSCTGWAPCSIPPLAGYWGIDDIAAATEVFADLICTPTPARSTG